MNSNFINLSPNLSSLPIVDDAETRSITAENPTGEKGNGAKVDTENS